MNSKQTLSNLAIRFVNAGGSVLMFFIASRFLGSSGRGDLSVYIANLTLVTLINEIVFGSGYIYLSHRYLSSDIIKKGLLFTLFTSILAPTLLTLFNLSDRTLIYYLISNSFLFATNNIIYLHLRSLQNINKHNQLLLLSIALQLIATLLLFYFEASIQHYIMAQTISYLVITILGVSNLKIEASKHIHLLSWKKMFSNGIQASLSNWLNFIGTRLSFYVIVLYLHSSENLGIYSAACILSESIWIIPFALATPLYPALSHETQIEVKRKLINKYTRLSFVLSGLAALLLITLPESLYTLILGNSFQGIKVFMLILIPAICIHSAAKIVWNYFQANGQFKFNTYAALISIVVLINALLILTPIYQTIGIAYSTALGYLAYSLSLFIFYLLPIKK
jgi:O-antigen/teichoic acid export membrane protein